MYAFGYSGLIEVPELMADIQTVLLRSGDTSENVESGGFLKWITEEDGLFAVT